MKQSTGIGALPIALFLAAVGLSLAVSAQEGETEKTAPDSDSGVGKDKDGITGQETHAIRLRDLEERVSRLKEQIFRSRARLTLLAETILDRKIAGARTRIVLRNDMGATFRLNKAVILLDGAPVFNQQDDTGALADKKSIDLFDGPVMPGDHTLNIVLHFQGHGYGVFSYLKGYSFKTRSTYTFSVSEGKQMTLTVVAFEKGGVTAPLEERPAIRFSEEVSDYQPTAGTSAPVSGDGK